MTLPCQEQCGTLSAVRDGGDVKLTVSYADTYQHAFSVDWYAGVGGDGAEVWVPIQFNGHRIARGDTAYDRDAPFSRTYRALIYREVDGSGHLHTNGNYTPSATV